MDVWPASVLQSVQKNSGDERQTRQVRGLRFAFCVALLVCWLALVIAFLLREAEVFVGTESNRVSGFPLPLRDIAFNCAKNCSSFLDSCGGLVFSGFIFCFI